MNHLIQPDKIIHSIQVHQLIPGRPDGSDMPGTDPQNGNDIRICHASYTIFCVLDGICNTRVNSQEQFSLCPSDLLLLPPGIPALFTARRPVICLVIGLDPAFLLNTFKTDALFSCCTSSLKTPELKQMTAHLLSLSRLYLTEKEQQHYQILSCLYSCLQVLRSLPSSAQKALPDPASSARFLEISDYIDRHIQEPLTLQGTAAAMELTPQYLASCFQKSSGCTFMAYLNRRKAQACLPWLAYTSLSDSEIADAMGFRNAAAFQKCIRDQFQDTTENIRARGRLSRISFSSFLPQTIIPDPLRYLTPNSDSSFASHAPTAVPAQVPEETGTTLLPSTVIPLTLREKLDDSWRYILNIGFASQLTNVRLRSQIQDIQSRIHFQYGRICRLLDLTLSRQINGRILYSYEIIFQTLDFLLSIHLTPFLELGFKSEKIHSHFTETHVLSAEKGILSYYDMLLCVLPDFIRSCCNRYGQDIVSQWRFEVYYDEIEHVEHLHELTFVQYVDYLKRISSIIRSFVPGCGIGGTGFNTYLPLSSLKQELSTLRSADARIDFFSIYVYGGIGHDFDTHLSLDKDLVLDKTRQAVSLIQSCFPTLPVLVTEFSFCYSSRSYLNDSLFQSSFIIRYLVQQLTKVQGMGYFSLSDLNVRYKDTDEIFFGGNGLYNIHGIRKPAYYAYEFFENLGTFLLGKGDHYIFTANSRSSLQGILFHYSHIDETLAYSQHGEELLTSSVMHFQSGQAEQMEFVFTDVLPGNYIVKRYRITGQAANPLTHWSKYRYFRSLSEKDLRFFRYLSHPEADLFVMKAQYGEPLRLSVTLKPQEVQLLLIDFSAESPKEAYDEIQD